MATLNVKRGDSLRVRLQAVDNGEPTTLAGCTAWMQVRDAVDGSLLVDVSTDDHLSIDGEAGVVFVNVPASLMDIPIGIHDMDVQVTFADQAVKSSETYRLNVLPDVTRGS